MFLISPFQRCPSSVMLSLFHCLCPILSSNSFLLAWRNALGISSLKTSLSWPQIPCSHHSISLGELARLLSSHPTAISPLTSHLLCSHPRLSRVPTNGICLQKTEHKGFLFTPILVSQQSSMMLN